MAVLVTGVTGQIGSYLAEALVASGRVVWGTRGASPAPLPAGVRDAGTFEPEGAAALLERLAADGPLHAVVHLAARSRVADSFAAPLSTWDVNTRASLALGEAAAAAKLRFVFASSAEIFAGAQTPVQDESTPLSPRSPYGAAKAAVHLYVQSLREGRGAAALNAIFYVAESERRPLSFVFAKLTRGLAEVALGRRGELLLGNTAAVRDFCHARDAAAAVLRLLRADAPPGDYVVATGAGHAVLEIARVACAHLGLDVGRVVRHEPSLLRAADAPSLVGDAGKLRALGWTPSLDFESLVRTITDHHLRALRAEPTGAS